MVIIRAVVIGVLLVINGFISLVIAVGFLVGDMVIYDVDVMDFDG